MISLCDAVANQDVNLSTTDSIVTLVLGLISLICLVGLAVSLWKFVKARRLMKMYGFKGHKHNGTLEKPDKNLEVVRSYNVWKTCLIAFGIGFLLMVVAVGIYAGITTHNQIDQIVNTTNNTTANTK